MQLKVNEHLRKLAEKHNVRTICTNDVHFVDETMPRLTTD